MKAVQLHAYGEPNVLIVKEDITDPVPKEGQILVEVHAAGLNPFDAKLKSGVYQNMMPLSLPCTPGGDFSGVVRSVGAGVVDFQTGDEVFGSAIVLNGGSGAYAQIAAANVANSAKKPMRASFEEAAALPLVGASAVQAIEEHIKLGKGQKILIHGGAGGIGHMAVQLAKSKGAYVATTASGQDTAFVKSLGADQVVDYKTEQFETILKDFDAVYDTVGGETTAKSFHVVKSGGILVSMLGKPDDALAKQYGVTVIGQNTKTNAAHLKRAAELVDAGHMRVHVDKVFPLDQVQEAFIYLETGHPQGKIVLTVA